MAIDISNPTEDWGGWLQGVRWYEFSRSTAPGHGTWGATSTTESLTIVVDWNDENTAIQNILGYAKAGVIGAWNISTTTNADGSVGQSVLSVANTTPFAALPTTAGFAAGLLIFVGIGGSNPEPHLILSVDSVAKTITLNEPLVFLQPSGANIQVMYANIERKLPVHHPRYKWLWATRITDITRIGPLVGQVVTTITGTSSIGTSTLGVSSSIGLATGNPIIIDRGSVFQQQHTIDDVLGSTSITHQRSVDTWRQPCRYAVHSSGHRAVFGTTGIRFKYTGFPEHHCLYSVAHHD